jgi:hypothetical protein
VDRRFRSPARMSGWAWTVALTAAPYACANSSTDSGLQQDSGAAAAASQDASQETPGRGATGDGAMAGQGDGAATSRGDASPGSEGASAGPGDATLSDAATGPDTAAAADAPTGDVAPSNDGSPVNGSGETVGTGDINAPAMGPGPSLASTVGGAPFVLVKNWDFGTQGTIRGTSDLVAEFQFHDQFGTIANGTHYGGVIVAPTQSTAIGNLDPALNLPNNTQPVEDPSRPTRIYTADTIQCVLQPLSATQTTCTATKHDVGAGSLVAKWMPANGGALLGRDLLWETRIRLVSPCAAYWFSLWTSGNQWNNGAEMDTPESFGSSNVFPPAHLFHVNSVGGTDAIDYSSWPNGIAAAGIPSGSTDLTQFHTWTWLYRKDDTYVTYFDGYDAQHGTIHWTLGGSQGGTPINMTFLFDFTWAHTQVSSVNPSGVPASSVQMTYEMDYSRVYMR